MILALLLALTAQARQEQFEHLLRTYPERPPQVTLGLVQTLIDEGPFEGRDRALYWEGSARLSLGDRDGARAFFRRLATEHPQSPWIERSLLGEAEAATQERNFGAALAFYGRAAHAVDPSVRELARISSAQVLILRTRQHVAWAAAAFALLVAVLLFVRARRGTLRPLPAELRIVGPVLLLIMLLSARQDPAPRAAVLELCSGALVLLGLSGYALRVRPLGGRAGHAALTLAALASVAYVAVWRHELVGMVQETFRAGPE